ncbi:MAG: TetR/AcrR family transcriptional regulator [Bryobacteraceae bacterium]
MSHGIPRERTLAALEDRSMESAVPLNLDNRMTQGVLEAKVNKNELRAKKTRQLLLRSAEKIFARDGYEGAELGEIAALAGRTKGAIYDHFKSKEDIFLALMEQRTTHYRAKMEQMLAKSTSIEQNIEVLRSFYLELIEDEALGLLMLEVKLFAIRHPKSRARLREFFSEVMPPDQETRLTRLLGSASEGSRFLSRSVSVQSIQPMLSALVLEAKFAPKILDKSVLRTVANLIFDALLIKPSAS